jgi:hypothetical protein
MSTQQTPADDQWAHIGHYYEPIPFYSGRVLKYAGIACPMNEAHMMAKPGIIMLPAYISDRITADTHEPFTGGF